LAGLQDVNKSLSLDPDYSWARNLKGIILFKRGNSQDSMEEFKRAIALDNNIAAHINLAIMLSEQDQYKESEGIIKSASYDRIDFKVRAHYLLGLSYRNMNKHDLAIRELELAENLFDVWASENEDSHFYTYSYRIPILRDLSELYSRSGDNKRAMERLQKAVNITLDHESSSGTDQRDPRKGYMVFE
jgi:tetratricopeptide (TPR) repeat protein